MIVVVGLTLCHLNTAHGQIEPRFAGAVPQPSSFALIVGVERYRDLPPAVGARADAEGFARLARETFGVPAKNIQIAVDERAGRLDLEKHLDWLRANVDKSSRIYFFYSGHGAPDASSGTPFILPYDADPRYLARTAFELRSILATLEETKAKDVLAFVDACFSGSGGRSVLAPGTRPLVRVKELDSRAQIALFSAASELEISGPAPGESRGLFSKYLVEALAAASADVDGDGQITLAELADWVQPRVAREAKRDNREQHPQLKLGSSLDSPSRVPVIWGVTPPAPLPVKREHPATKTVVAQPVVRMSQPSTVAIAPKKNKPYWVIGLIGGFVAVGIVVGAAIATTTPADAPTPTTTLGVMPVNF